MLGCDIRDMDADTLRIITNKDVIAINQDNELNRPYRLRSGDGMTDPDDIRVYAKILENGDIALGFFNFSDGKICNRFVTLDMIGLDADTDIKINVKDLWSGEDIRVINDTINVASIEAHACKLYRVCVNK